MQTKEVEVTARGELYSADCRRCGYMNYTHEWAYLDHNERRDAMEAGTLRCCNCGGTVDPETFTALGKHWYAARGVMPGFLDCTDKEFGETRRGLKRWYTAHGIMPDYLDCTNWKFGENLRRLKHEVQADLRRDE